METRYFTFFCTESLKPNVCLYLGHLLIQTSHTATVQGSQVTAKCSIGWHSSRGQKIYLLFPSFSFKCLVLKYAFIFVNPIVLRVIRTQQESEIKSVPLSL